MKTIPKTHAIYPDMRAQYEYKLINMIKQVASEAAAKMMTAALDSSMVSDVQSRLAEDFTGYEDPESFGHELPNFNHIDELRALILKASVKHANVISMDDKN